MPGGKQISKPNLMSPALPTADAPKHEMYVMKGSWYVIYTRDGRPYYYNPIKKLTQWAHPYTGAVHPPARPPEEMRQVNPYLMNSFRAVGGAFVAVWAFAIFGGTPVLAHIFSDSVAVVQ